MKALLSPQERKIYTLLGALDRPLSVKEIREHTGLNNNFHHVLKSLIEMDLIQKLFWNKYKIVK